MRLRLPVLRRLTPWVLGVTLAILAILGLTRIFFLREQLSTQVRRQAEERLQERVAAWEEEFLDRLETWLTTAAERHDAPRGVQAQLRDQAGWIESIYLWRPARATRREPVGRTPARMIFPTRTLGVDRSVVATHPCIRGAKRLQYGDAAPLDVADAYVAGCADAADPVRLEASIEAASVLDNAGLPGRALTALDAFASADELSVEAGLSRGIPADRVVAPRNRRAELLMELGQEERAISLYFETGEQLAELDAPDAEGLETWRWSLLDEMRRHGRPVLRQQLELRFQALDRRLRAWREVENQLLPEADDLASAESQLIRDQYADRPFLLYYGIVTISSGERIGAALQLDQRRVLADFLARAGGLEGDLVITEPDGTWVLGGRRREGRLALQIPFARTLTHLRVNLHQDALDRRAASMADQWIIPLAVTILILIIGFFALLAQITASRRLAEHLARQKEFTTRVTHELKTPLAGIRVMAENLEIGAFKDDITRARMAARIVEEADRLTSRIDEVLAVTREKTLPAPETFDLEEIVYELIDTWGPRMEQHGVAFEADLDEAPPVHGDPQAVRDAIGCLLDNALKYRDPESPTPRVWLELGQKGPDAVVRVTDNGLGVPPGMRRTIFERFVRVEGPNRGVAGGHGLGLAQVAETARRHGGAVHCEEGVEGGARFVLRLAGQR